MSDLSKIKKPLKDLTPEELTKIGQRESIDEQNKDDNSLDQLLSMLIQDNKN